MISQILKLALVSSLVVQFGCDITFKRKSEEKPSSYVAVKNIKNKTVKIKNSDAFSRKDARIISSYYKDDVNEIIKKDMITHSKISKKDEEKLVVGKIIPRHIQVIPLPLKLESALSSISLNMLRVQVGKYIILMNVKTRKILGIIKI